MSLKDLAGGQVKSLPVKNSPLLDESGKNIGVSGFYIYNHSTQKTSRTDRNKRRYDG